MSKEVKNTMEVSKVVSDVEDQDNLPITHSTEEHSYRIETLTDFNSFANLSIQDKTDLALAATLLDGEAVTGFSRASDILQAINLAKHLNVPISWVLANYSPIKGKLTANTEARTALAMAAGLKIEIIYNHKALRFLALYNEKTGATYNLPEGEILDDDRYCIYRTEHELDHDTRPETKGKIPALWAVIDDSGIYDYITRVKGTILLQDGSTHISYANYKYSEAVLAGLVNKENWKNYPLDCMLARAKKRLVVNSVVNNFQFPSTEELASIHNIELNQKDI